MALLREQEPEINVYVGAKGLDTGKRSLAKRNTNGKPYKKQKVAASLNDRPIPRTSAFTPEESSERTRQEDVSYRHLFSFAKTTDEQSQPDKSTKPAFSFLRKGSENEKTENGESTKSLGFLQNDQSRSDLDKIKARHSPGSAEDDMKLDRRFDVAVASEYLDRRAGSGHFNEEGSTKLASQRGNRQPYEEFESIRAQAADALVIPEVIESCPDAILRIATRFCRTKSIQELEEEWCAPGGIRETMKRDFKQKRQNVTRGRKLGSSNRR